MPQPFTTSLHVHRMTHTAPAALSAADGATLTDALMRLLRLKTTPIVMQMFATVAEMQAVPRIRRPSHVHRPAKSGANNTI